MTIWLEHGDMRVVLPRLLHEQAEVHSIVTDPPYGLDFMGKHWDAAENVAFQYETWRMCYDLLPPGGHLLAFSGTRTYHRMAMAIEEAGFEIRDMLTWIYGQGFPKSHNVAKGIAKRRVEDLEPIRVVCRAVRAAMDARSLNSRHLAPEFNCNPRLIDHWAARDTDSQPNLPTNEQWKKLKTLLPIGDDLDAEVTRLNDRKGTHGERWAAADIVGQVERDAPGFADVRFNGDRTIRNLDAEAAAWEGWGTALKPAMEPICVARKPLDGTVAANVLKHGAGALNIDGCRVATNGEDRSARYGGKPSLGGNGGVNYAGRMEETWDAPAGRWPANVVHDGSDEVVNVFPESKNGHHPRSRGKGGIGQNGHGGQDALHERFDRTGGNASRFFYCAKANAKERMGFDHPTVKPIALLRWLTRLVTPLGGVVLDPFAGTGTMGAACEAEGFDAILVEREEKYAGFIRQRLPAAQLTVHP